MVPEPKNPSSPASLHIDAGKAYGAQQYNRFHSVFSESESSSRDRKFAVDGVLGCPYKPGSRRRAGPPRRFRDWGAGSEDPAGVSFVEGPDLVVVCSMHRLLGKGYAGGGDHEVLRHGLFSSSPVRKSDASRIE